MPPVLVADDVPNGDASPPLYRGSSSDPTFGYLIGMALAVGLTPLIPDSADLRYVVLWAVLAGFGVLAWLFGVTTRITQEEPENLVWGAVFGGIVAVPLLLVGGSTLSTSVHLLFRTSIGGEVQVLPMGAALALLVFVQPLAESLFFRGVMQENRPFMLVALLASIWSAALYYPMLDIGEYPVVGFVITVVIVIVNLAYSYVRRRNGLAAAWVCQIVVNVLLLFIPFIGS